MAWCNKCGEDIDGVADRCPNCDSDPPQQSEAGSEEDSRAAPGSVEAAEREEARRFAQLLLDEARWRIDYCETKNYFILQQWLRKYESGLVDLLRMIPPPSQNVAISCEGGHTK